MFSQLKCSRGRCVFSKKNGRDGSPSRPYLAEQLPLSAFLLTLAPDLKFPDQIPFFAIIKPDSGKYVNVWPPFFDPFPGFILPWTFAEAAPKKMLTTLPISSVSRLVFHEKTSPFQSIFVNSSACRTHMPSGVSLFPGSSPTRILIFTSGWSLTNSRRPFKWSSRMR